MAVLTITSSQFEPMVNAHPLIFLDFWAPWCTPCKQFSKTYEQFSEQFPQLCCAQVNIEEEKKLAELFDIHSIPCLRIYKAGLLIYSVAGSVTQATLKELAQQALEFNLGELL